MSLQITVTFTDSVNGNTTDTINFNDADAATFLSVLGLLNANPDLMQQQRQILQAPGHQRQVSPQNPALAYDALYHSIAQNFLTALKVRIQGYQTLAAQAAAMAQAASSVAVLTPSANAQTTPKGKSAVAAPTTVA